MLRQFNVGSFNELEIGRDISGSGPSSPAEMNLGPIRPMLSSKESLVTIIEKTRVRNNKEFFYIVAFDTIIPHINSC